jgi:hypothetical protein
MAQAFTRRAVLALKLSAIGSLAAIAVFARSWRTDIGHTPGEPVQQPVPFSHKHHVGDDGIDCRYCHTTVETTAFAGLPPLSTCMSCHSQLYTQQPVLRPVVESWRGGAPLRWNRVHQLPGFVYFDHSIHVNKGVGCSSCHGAVDRMPLTWRTQSLEMKWCLDCHRHPEAVLRQPGQIFDMAWQPPPDQAARGPQLLAQYHIDKPRLIECSVCHR